VQLKEAKDWTLWKLQAKVVLKSLGAFKVVYGSEKCPILAAGASVADAVSHGILFEN
jgi:hypothetical protein